MSSYKLPKHLHPDFRFPDKKPVGAVEIDWSNPLTKGLTYCLVCNSPDARNLVNGVPDIVGSGVSFEADHYEFNASSTGIITINTPFDKLGGVTGANVFSSFIIARRESGASFPAFIGRGDTSSNEWMLRETGGNLNFFEDSASFGGTFLSSVGEKATHGFSFGYGPGDNDGIVVNQGVVVGSTTLGSAIDLSLNAKSMTLGGADGASSRYFRGGIYYVFRILKTSYN